MFALPVNVRVFDIFRLQSLENVGAMLVWVDWRRWLRDCATWLTAAGHGL